MGRRVNLVDYKRKELMTSKCAVFGCTVRGQHRIVVKRADFPSNGVIIITSLTQGYCKC